MRRIIVKKLQERSAVLYVRELERWSKQAAATLAS